MSDALDKNEIIIYKGQICIARDNDDQRKLLAKILLSHQEYETIAYLNKIPLGELNMILRENNHTLYNGYIVFGNAFKDKDIVLKSIESLNLALKQYFVNLKTEYEIEEDIDELFENKDIDKLTILAEKGNIEAQNNVGNMYYVGLGVKQDYKEAIKWYKKAANQGWITAQQQLGHIYFGGIGVNKDYEEARKWYKKAASQGDEISSNTLEMLTIMESITNLPDNPPF